MQLACLQGKGLEDSFVMKAKDEVISFHSPLCKRVDSRYYLTSSSKEQFQLRMSNISFLPCLLAATLFVVLIAGYV